MLAWMLYATAVGAMVAGAAFALERLAAIWGLPRRIVWVLAIVIAVVVPPALAFRRAPARRPTTSEVQRVSIPMGGAAVGGLRATTSPTPSYATRFVVPQWDRAATVAWLGASVLLLGFLARTFIVVRRRRTAWRESEVDGHRVLIAGDAGPAVVGALNPRIVLPTWALALGDDERRMMLHHEAEHVRAGDPVLLLASAIVVALFPWNPVLWLLVRRLRLAIEIDCDRRVLRVVDTPREYGMLLLAVGARHGAPLPLAASLAERQPLLERRILAMTSLRPERPLIASLPFIIALAVAGTVAAQTPQPDSLAAMRDRGATVAARQAVARSARASAVASSVAVVPATASTPATTAAAASDIEQTVVAKTAANARAAAAAAVTDSVVTASSAVRREDVPLDTIAMWVARYHPDVIRGNGHPNRVTIVVGLDESYLASSVEDANAVSPRKVVLDRDDIESVEVLKGAGAIAEYGPAAQHGIVMIRTKSNPDTTLDEIRRRALVERLQTEQARGAALGASSDPIFVVDGVVVPSSEVARAGLVSPAGSPVANMHIAPTRILQVDVLKLPAGRIGPDATSVIVIQLKDDGR